MLQLAIDECLSTPSNQDTLKWGHFMLWGQRSRTIIIRVAGVGVERGYSYNSTTEIRIVSYPDPTSQFKVRARGRTIDPVTVCMYGLLGRLLDIDPLTQA